MAPATALRTIGHASIRVPCPLRGTRRAAHRTTGLPSASPYRSREILAASDGATKALMLTTFGLDEYVYEALAAGASGFLLKDATFPELLHAVRVVAAGNALLSPEITKRLVAEFTRQRAAVPPAPAGGIEGLTAREVEVLVLIAQGLSNAEIADRLTITDHTVKTHINRLFAKMGLRDRAQAVILAYERGLVRAASARG